MPTSWPRKVWATPWVTTWRRPTAPRWKKAATPSTPWWVVSNATSAPTGNSFWTSPGRTKPPPPYRLRNGSVWPSALPKYQTISMCTHWRARCWTTAPPWAAAKSRWTGAWASTWRLPPCWRKAFQSASRGKTVAVAHSPTATPCCTTRSASVLTKASTSRCRTSSRISPPLP